MKCRVRVMHIAGWLFTATCAAMIVLTAVFWVRSYRNYGDVHGWVHVEGGLVHEERGVHVVASENGALSYSGGTGRVGTSMDEYFFTSRWRLEWKRSANDFGFAVRCPHWFVIALLVTLLASVQVPSVLRTRRRARRRKAGRCIRCGYDLTGNVSRVCPECGQAVARLRTRDQT